MDKLSAMNRKQIAGETDRLEIGGEGGRCIDDIFSDYSLLKQ